MTDRPQETLERMEAMLRRCRRRIMRAEVSVRLRAGLQFYLSCLLGIAAIFLVLRILAWSVGTPAPGWDLVLAAAVIFALVIFGRAVLQGILGKPVQMADAAERLDLSQETHNRIATAMALLRSGDDSDFAKAAIHDGFDYLERLQAEEPHVDPSPTSWRRKGSFLVASVAMVLAGMFLTSGPRSAGIDDPATPETTPVASLDRQSDPVTPDAGIEPKERLASRGAPRPSSTTPPREEDDADGDRSERPEPGAESRAAGPAGQHASGKSRSSQSSSDSRSAASGTAVEAEPGASDPAKPRKPRLPRKQKPTKPKIGKDGEKKAGSIAARGSSGSGSMRTAQNDWSSKVKAKSDERDDADTEEEMDEEMDPEKQRLGAQPSLKNRSSQVSRQLSLFMGKDPANKQKRGRGGPSGQKKSRGTATMIMGVPVPGFVQGRLIPGPSKSTQEDVEPSPREGEHARRSEVGKADPEEGFQERFHPPAAHGIRARDYLINSHAEQENKRNEADLGK